MAHPLTANLVMQKARADRPSMVRRLNVSGAQVDDISVLGQYKHLEVCSLSANEVSDLAPLAGCEGLRELYLRKNDVCDLFQVLHLRHLRQLEVLTMSENPVSAHECYRRYIIAALPQLVKLDDIEVTHDERTMAANEFPDVTVCDVPMPLPTKRELHENRSAHGSPNQRPARGGSGSFDPPPSARGRPTVGVRANVTPPAADTPTPREDSFSDFPGDDSGADAPPRQYDDRPVGGGNQRVTAARRGQPAAAHRDPLPDSPQDVAIREREREQRAPVSRPAHGAHTHGNHNHAGHAQAAHARGGAIPSSRTNAIGTAHLGIREENVVRAINLLLSELSPAGLEAVRRQLQILDT